MGRLRGHALDCVAHMRYKATPYSTAGPQLQGRHEWNAQLWAMVTNDQLTATLKAAKANPNEEVDFLASLGITVETVSTLDVACWWCGQHWTPTVAAAMCPWDPTSEHPQMTTARPLALAEAPQAPIVIPPNGESPTSDVPTERRETDHMVWLFVIGGAAAWILVRGGNRRES